MVTRRLPEEPVVILAGPCTLGKSTRDAAQDSGMSIVIRGYRVVLLPVPAHFISRGEYGNEVRV